MKNGLVPEFSILLASLLSFLFYSTLDEKTRQLACELVTYDIAAGSSHLLIMSRDSQRVQMVPGVFYDRSRSHCSVRLIVVRTMKSNMTPHPHHVTARSNIRSHDHSG